MNGFLKTTCMMAIIAGTTCSISSAQTQADRDRMNQQNQNQNTPKTDATRQPGSTDTMDAARQAWHNDYFGRPTSSATGYNNLSNLSGAWKLQVTMYDPNTSDERVIKTSTGYAERRWILNGTKLAECYSLDGDHSSLPMRNHMGFKNKDGMKDGMKDGQWRDSDAMNRNPNDPSSRNDRNDPNNRTDNDMGRATGTPTPGATGGSGQQPIDRGTNTGSSDNNPGTTTSTNTPNTNRPDSMRDTNRTASASEHGQGICMWGYDPAANEFNVVWTDASTPAIRFDTGKLERDGELKLMGKYTDPRDSKSYQTKTIISMDSPNQQRVTMYRDGGVLSREVKVFEIVYTRDANPSWISDARGGYGYDAGNAYGSGRNTNTGSNTGTNTGSSTPSSTDPNRNNRP